MNVPTVRQNSNPQVSNSQNSQNSPTKLYFSMPSAQEMQQLIDFCKVMASAPFYAKLGPGGIMAIYLTAKEHNLPFMACLNGGMHTFDGKVSFSAQLVNAMIINAGHKADILQLDEQLCRIHFKRGDRKNDPEYKGLVYEYTLKQAEKAGYLKKSNWMTSPKDMLFSRCLTGGGRKHVPEVFVGVLVAGELIGDEADGEIIPQVPLEASNTNQTPIPTNPVTAPPVEPPKQLAHVKIEGYDAFQAKHIAEHGETLKEYVRVTCDKANMPEIQVWNSAVKNEGIFIERFQKWKEKLPPTEHVPRSMDELVT